MGREVMGRCDLSSFRYVAIDLALASMLFFDSLTYLGLPVLPDVGRRRAKSLCNS